VDLAYGGFAHLARTVRYRRRSGAYSTGALARVTRRYGAALSERRMFRGGSGRWLDLSRPRQSWATYRRRVRSALRRADAHRATINAIYSSSLPAGSQLPARFQGWRFNVVVPDPDELVARLFAVGLFASRHYAPLGGVFAEGRFPVAERLHCSVVNLFNDDHVDEDMARRTASIVAAHLRGSRRRVRRRALG
jgi:hypothetical protein